MSVSKSRTKLVVFVMIDDTGTEQTGKSVTAAISKDGGAFAACVNSPVEISDGFYKLSLTADELGADVVALKLTATGCIQQNIVMYTQDLQENIVTLLDKGYEIQVRDITPARQYGIKGIKTWLLKRLK